MEFCDTSEGDGEFRKFSAFKVGDHIIPCHLLVARHWCVKSGRSETTEASLLAGRKFVEDNPHGEWLAQIFGVAGIDYGRVDYGVLNGRPQVWEINLNPTIGRGAGGGRNSTLPATLRTLREHHREAFHSRLRAAFSALDARERRIRRERVDQQVSLGAHPGGNRRHRAPGANHQTAVER